MGLAVVEGATLQCTLGMTESILSNTSGRFIIECMRVATIKDHLALVQVDTFNISAGLPAHKPLSDGVEARDVARSPRGAR